MQSADILRVVSGPSLGQQIDLVGRVVIGRSDAGLRIDDPATSRTHAVVQAGDPVTVADAGSSRGTTLDGVAVTTPVPWPVGATLRIGRSTVRRLDVVRHRGAGGFLLTLRGADGEERAFPVGHRVVVGRDQTCDVRIDDPAVSRRHLVLERRGESLVAEDPGSRAGTLLNGRRLATATAVRDGDELEIGGTAWTLRIGSVRVGTAPREFRVRDEAGDAVLALHIDADPASSIGEVADAIAATLGLAAGPRRFVYRDCDGIVPHPDETWAAVPWERGELLVLAEGEVADLGGPDPRAPRTRVVRPGARIVHPPTAVVLDAPRTPESASLRGRGIGWQLAGGAVGVLGGLAIAVAMNNWLFAVIGGVAGIGASVFSILSDQSRRRHRVREFREKVAAVERRADESAAAQADALTSSAPGPDSWEQLLSAGAVWERSTGDADFLRLRLGVGDRRAAVRIDRTRDDPPPELADVLAGLDAQRLLHGVPAQTPAGGVFGVVGPNRPVDALLRALVLDAALHHAPSVLSIHLLAEADEWDFAIWLPHVADAAISRLVRAPTAADLTARVAADLDRGRRVLVVGRAGAGPWSELARSWRVDDGLLVVAATEPEAVPREAASWAVLSDGGARVDGTLDDAPVGTFVADGLDHDTAAGLALRAAPLVDPHAHTAAAFVSRSLLELSGARGPGGIDVARNWQRGHPRLAAVLGVAEDGAPVEVELRHTVIAGTTGSGKSELLATLLASLVARQSPEELTLFLIDFKGGATFSRFAEAPHVVGVVTDLESDERLARRAFQALDVELRRRKALLGEARANDIDRYRELGASPPLPTLLVVIDEFALLAQTVPEVKAQLDTIAAQGRSLGIFLVLATQSPTGVITPAIRTNTDLWLSLRVVSEQESREILGAPDAARLPVDTPGRALVRRGAETRLVGFQTARVTVVAAAIGAALVTVRQFGATTVRRPALSQPSTQADDLELLIAHVREAARLGRIPLPPALWLPPLPREVVVDELPESGVDAPGALAVRLGLADLVTQQRQPVHEVDLAATGLLITGAPRSGRSTALLQVAADLAERHPPARVHVYGIHANGALDPLTALPHTGGIVQVDDVERVTRLLDRLSAIVESRRSGARDPAAARIVLLVDDYPAVREALEQRGHGRPHDQLVAIAVSGRPSGVHVAIATPQPVDLRMAVLAGLGHRLMLRVVDRSDYQSIGWRPQPGEQPPPLPGRGVDEDGVEVQVVAADVRRAAELARAWSPDGGPSPIRALPRRVSVADLPAAPHGADAIGLGGRELGAALVDASPGAHLAVLGESGTGRSTALLAVARAHLRRPDARVLAFVPRGGALSRLDGHPAVELYTADRADALVASAAARPDGALVVVDDAERWPSTAADALERLLRQGRDSGLRAAVAARAGDWSRSFEAWTRYLASLKSALLLSGFADLGPTFDVRLEPLTTTAPGRGYLVARGAAEVIQVASDEA